MNDGIHSFCRLNDQFRSKPSPFTQSQPCESTAVLAALESARIFQPWREGEGSLAANSSCDTENEGDTI